VAKSAGAKAKLLLAAAVVPIVNFYTISKAEYKQPLLRTTAGLPHDLKNY